jgi:hypothetical protein
MSDIFKKGPSSLEKIERGLKKLENELFDESLKVVNSAITHTFDLDPAMPEETPAAWLQELEDGTETVESLGKRKRIALAAWQSPKNAPVALQIAAKVLSGMQKARAMGDQGAKTLNVNVVTINAPMPVFEEKEIDHE